jgi:hypothetical protein
MGLCGDENYVAKRSETPCLRTALDFQNDAAK